jgi:hypothetical protein
MRLNMPIQELLEPGVLFKDTRCWVLTWDPEKYIEIQNLGRAPAPTHPYGIADITHVLAASAWEKCPDFRQPSSPFARGFQLGACSFTVCTI